jgi:hypothetical protein
MTRVDSSIILSVLKISQLVQNLNRGYRQTAWGFYKLLSLKKSMLKIVQFHKGVTAICIYYGDI